MNQRNIQCLHALLMLDYYTVINMVICCFYHQCQLLSLSFTIVAD
jgi:hypothetical protein